MPAVILEDATEEPGQAYDVATAPARWHAGGAQHEEAIDVPVDAKAGDSVDVWVKSDGSRVAAPTPTDQAAVAALLAASASWFGAVGAVWLLAAGVRLGLARRRVAGWDRELRLLLDDTGRAGSQP
ncbi:hypothetical protein [Mycolicibacterium wolinskyi]|uniref:Rv1733c family protein n=1 Tax=Mycolicibacterium wolinskyi TaxID=59750 RepID=UPI00104270BC|nr:hypothetical protein [Mycolicibacterium wolinskyi]